MRQQCMTLDSFNEALRAGPYAWPGGYPLYFIMLDGDALSFKAAETEAARIREAIAETLVDDGWRGANAQWLPVACEINYEDADLYCDHTGARIESAYGEEESV